MHLIFNYNKQGMVLFRSVKHAIQEKLIEEIEELVFKIF